MTELFISAFFLGVLFNAAPGAILAESLRRGLKGGFAPALAVQVGSLVGDGLWVVLGLMGAAALISIPYVQIPLAVSGALLLGYLAYESFQDGLQPVPELSSTQNEYSDNKNALFTGAALSVSNPLNITYWAALGGTISAISGQAPSSQHFIVFIGGFMLSSLIWCFFASGVIAVTRTYLSKTLWRTLHFGCSAGLMALMIMVFWGLFDTPLLQST